MKECTVIFKPANKIIKVPAGTNLMEAARKAQIFIDAACGGRGVCGKCRVKIIGSGYFTRVTPLITEEDKKNNIVLACVTNVKDDITVVTENDSLVNNIMAESMKTVSDEVLENSKKSLTDNGIELKNSFSVISIKPDEPSLDDNLADWERIKRYLKTEKQIDNVVCPIRVMRKIPGIFRKNEWNVNLFVQKLKDGSYKILNIHSSEKKKLYALAVDIGTTTVAASIIDMVTGEIAASSSCGNLQIQYGADVISRIIYSQKDGGLEKLHDSIVNGTINPLIHEMMNSINIESDDIIFCSAAGNTVMSHLFLGVDPTYIRLEPYIPVFRQSELLFASDLGIDINKDAQIFIMPNVGSYVGGDITSGVLASGLWNKQENILFMDLGTNGEIVLGNSDWIMTCACSAGPAFEGGGINCGMRASNGAIDKIKINKETFEPEISIIGNEKPRGICGSGIIDAVAELFSSGIIDSKGKIKRDLKCSRIIIDDEADTAAYVIADKKETYDGRDIYIDEVDIDSFIRTKGAVFSGIMSLVGSTGLDLGEIENIIIAGGIGRNLDIENSKIIGLLPDIDTNKFNYIGNSSLIGAYLSVLSDGAKDKVKEISDNMTYIELSTYPGYMDEFVSSCFLPHTNTNLFPNVIKKIKK